LIARKAQSAQVKDPSGFFHLHELGFTLFKRRRQADPGEEITTNLITSFSFLEFLGKESSTHTNTQPMQAPILGVIRISGCQPLEA
jgi:hypothetical protein